MGDLENHHVYGHQPVGLRQLSVLYLDSYTHSGAVADEHAKDARAVLGAMLAMPGFLAHLGRQPTIETLDVGSGEALKSQRILVQLLTELGHTRGRLRAVDPDLAQLAALRARVAEHPDPRLRVSAVATTIAGLLEDWEGLAGAPAYGYVTCFHMAYYLPQHRGTIPLLGKLAVKAKVPVFFITEGPGHLQALKWYMHEHHGFGVPATAEMLSDTLDAAGVEHTKPVAVPNRWPVDLSVPVGEMFARDFAFLLSGNWDCPPLTDRLMGLAGKWVRDHALRDGRGWYLDGPDALVVANPGDRWLA